MRWRQIAAFLVENLTAVFFVAGFLTFYLGVAGFSRPAANMAAGVLLMTIAVVPYVRRQRKG